GEHLLTPAHFGTKAIDPKLIEGGKDVASSAELFMKVLNGQGTEPQNKVVIANAALAISTAEDISIEQAIEKAEDSLFNRKALGCFERLKKTLAEA
ncbi:MAG: anthranilate phosphoribosyltransferase, partial [Flavobacteriaceae bacterium]